MKELAKETLKLVVGHDGRFYRVDRASSRLRRISTEVYHALRRCGVKVEVTGFPPSNTISPR